MSATKEMKIDSGLVTYTLTGNGKCEVSFNPANNFFIEKLFETFEALEREQGEFRAATAKSANNREFFSLVRERDTKVREIIDNLFGVPVCDAIFGDMSVFALADGLPVWCNLMLAVMDEVDVGVANEMKDAEGKLQKYIQKYQRKK